MRQYHLYSQALRRRFVYHSKLWEDVLDLGRPCYLAFFDEDANSNGSEEFRERCQREEGIFINALRVCLAAGSLTRDVRSAIGKAETTHERAGSRFRWLIAHSLNGASTPSARNDSNGDRRYTPILRRLLDEALHLLGNM